jgi:hypothetical protein
LAVHCWVVSHLTSVTQRISPSLRHHGLYFRTSGGFDTDVDPENGYPWLLWLAFIIAYKVGLHCSEVIVNVVRDEANWRVATSKMGTRPS